MQSLPFNVQSGSKIFFTRTTETEGSELWVTDGTAGGTVLVKDIEPGADGSDPLGFTPTKIGLTSGVYFFATTAVHGRELWISDGTPAGTKLVKDIYPGNGSSLTNSLISGSTFVAIPDTQYAFFAANDGVNGEELWTTDGTTLGTKMVADIDPGSASSSPSELRYLPISPFLPYIYFSADNGTDGREPYAANGTSALMIHDLNAGSASSNPMDIHLTDNSIVFAANEITSGRELWSTDLATPTLLADAVPGSDSSYTSNLMQLSSSQILYSSLASILDVYNSKLMTTNGTPAGTTTLANLDCLPGGILSLITESTLKTSKIINGKAVFSCYNFLSTLSSLWVSDGTAPNTKILEDFLFSPSDFYGTDFTLLQGNNKIILMANDGQGGMEPWSTDGTTEGTSLLVNLNPGEASSIDPTFAFLSSIGNQLNKSASIFPATIGTERKVYYSDGSVANTREIFDDSGVNTIDSYPENFFALGKKVLFSANDTKKGVELFETNGKPAGTKLLKNIFKAGNSSPENFEKLNETTGLFVATSQGAGRELWRTDGKKSGTKLVKNIKAGKDGSNPEIFKGKLRKKMFFQANNGLIGDELWVTEGTKRSTKLLKDINVGTEGTYINELVLLRNKAIFSAEDATNGEELWVSNGRTAGTVLLKDIEVTGGSNPSELTVVGDKVFFTAYTNANGTELWVTDGTLAGTALVKDIVVGAGSSNLVDLTAVGNNLFFVANDGVNGSELWRSDGTSAGTFMVEDIYVGATSSNPSYLTAISPTQVAFAAQDVAGGIELWIATADLGSASLVKDISIGAPSSSPRYLYAVPGKNKIVFSATTPTEGEELWLSDGTLTGTSLLADIEVGSESSYPFGFLAKGRKLYFTAATEATGNEPYTIKLP